jgi:hypothetical protein
MAKYEPRILGAPFSSKKFEVTVKGLENTIVHLRMLECIVDRIRALAQLTMDFPSESPPMADALRRLVNEGATILRELPHKVIADAALPLFNKQPLEPSQFDLLDLKTCPSYLVCALKVAVENVVKELRSLSNALDSRTGLSHAIQL